ncbi:hypothetical protein [Deefgea rivuli]|uniref:hypothetical protein n=1 Tax=Deefgea rivuli TaxID=400948 RepID=UPI000486E1E7|nr:hypothetical protein [Deefgea rivuli]
MANITHTADARLLHAALAFAAKQDPRYYLNGIHLRATVNGDGCIIEASNGHMAVVLHDKSGSANDTSIIVRRDIIKALPQNGTVTFYDDDSLSFEPSQRGKLKMSFSEITLEGKFPDLQRVLPRPENLKAGMPGTDWQRQFIIEALQFFPRLHGGYDSVRVFHSNNGETPPDSHYQPAAIFTNDEEDAFVIVMPLRGKPTLDTPRWFWGEQAEPQEAAQC